MGNRLYLGPALCLVLGAGCASHSVLSDQVRESHAAIARAVDAGAEEHAPRELALAREKILLGERWIAAGDYKPAQWLVEQARVDAELAAAKAAGASARKGGQPGKP
jgi:hypothetical protein